MPLRPRGAVRLAAPLYYDPIVRFFREHRVTTAVPSKKTLAGLGPPPLKPASFLANLRSARGNPFEIIPLEAYEQPYYVFKSIIGHVLMVNDPDGVRRVLLDNVANYPKETIGG